MGYEPIFSRIDELEVAAGIIPVHCREELSRSPLHKLQEQGARVGDCCGLAEVRRGKVRERRKPGVGEDDVVCMG